MKTKLVWKKAFVVCFCTALVMETIPGVPMTVKAETGALSSEEVIQGEAGEVNYSFSSEQEMLDAMSLAAKNQNFALYYDPKTMAIALTDLKTDKTYFSNPYHASADPLCTGNNAKDLESQVVLSYVDKSNAENKLWSSSDCVGLGQYKIRGLGDGVRFDMTLGKQAENQLSPQALPADRFEALLSGMNSRAQRRMKAFYILFAPN